MIRGIAPLTAMGLLALAGIGVLLLGLTTMEFLQDGDVPRIKAEWAPRLSTATEQPVRAAPLSAYQQTIARPVFFKTRQPFVPPPPPSPPPMPAVVPPPPPPPAADPEFSVGGIMINGEVKKAYLLRKGERTGSWLTEGEEVMGWKVQTIESGGAKLQKNGRVIELLLYPQ
jgi:hypothetical protein